MSPGEARAIRASVAFVWLATALGVVSPTYREIGAGYLDALGLPTWLMPMTCAFELVLGLWVLLRPAMWATTVLQVGMIAVFTALLALVDPMLLVNPFGMLTKNLPIVTALVALTLGQVEGWSPRVTTILRFGAAWPWFTEGLFPKLLFQQPVELAVVASSPLSFGSPEALLRGLGALQLVSFVCAWTLRGKWLRVCLWAQAGALLVLPVLVAVELPSLLVHPFGPLTKNVPILVATLLLARRC